MNPRTNFPSIRATTAGIVLAAFSMVPVHAKSDKPSRAYRTQWVIAPTEAPKGNQVAKEGDLLIKQRLYPLGMVTLSGDYKTTLPEEEIAAGTQLILADGAEHPVFCSTRYKRPGTLARILSTGPETGTQRCFVDSNSDGKFDQTFLGFNNVHSLPGVFGRLPKTSVPMEPIAYAKAKVTDFAEPYYVGIRYIQRGGLSRNKRQFMLVYGAKEPWGFFSFDQTPSIKDSDFPKATGMLGAVITILSGDRETVTYRVERMIPAQPFGVVVTTYSY